MDTNQDYMVKTRIDLPINDRLKTITLLNQQLADTFDMVSIFKQAHWNIKGPNFISLHKLFDEFAEGLLNYVDMLAERVTALGGLAMGTTRMAAESSRLTPYPANMVDEAETLAFVADQLANLAKSTREAADMAEENADMATNDLLIEVVRDLDKWLWFLDAHVQRIK